MKLLLSPVRSDDTVTYHREGERLIIEVNEQRDIFDFTGASDGVFHDFASDTLPFCPIISATKDADGLAIKVTNTYGPEPIQEEGEPDDVYLARHAEWGRQRSEYEVTL